jgi:hypothetical protein
MASIPKKVIQQLGQIAKQTGEAVVKEPLEVAKTAGQQIGVSPEAEGVEKAQTGGPSSQQLAQVKQKQEEEKRKIAFYRRRLRELASPPRAKEPPSVESQPTEAPPEGERKKGLEIVQAPGGSTKRGTALLGLRKKGKGTGEMGAFAKRSR